MGAVHHTSFAAPSAREICGGVLLLLVALLVADDARCETRVTAEMALPGCPDQCGNGVLIPYPFGIGSNCSRGPLFVVRCVENRPFLWIGRFWDPFAGSYEVIEISLQRNEVRILTHIPPVCNGSASNSVNIYIPECCTLSSTKNKFTTVGCNAFGTLTPSENKVTERLIAGVGCLVACESATDRVLADDSCSGFGCCQASVPQAAFSLDFTYNKVTNKTLPWLSQKGNSNDTTTCGYAFLTEASNYTFRTSHLSWKGNKTFPVVLDFSINDDATCVQAQNETSTYACKSAHSECKDSNYNLAFSKPFKSYTCACSQGYQGNPYVQDGCQDINECLDRNKHNCSGVCVNTPGGYRCHPSKPVTLIAISVTIATFLFLIAIGIGIYSFIKRKKYNKQKEIYFLQNGGLILQRQMSNNGVQNTFKMFTKEDIDQSTNHFDQNQVIGRGGNGVVFKGNLPNDGREFAIKKSLLFDGSRVEEFINEILILSQINHKNVVRLLGCCLEVEEPLLVYEYIPNGTLCDNIHEGSLPWEIRMKIANEAADALSHLHFKVNTPIIHRDVKSSNILIDGDFTAKVSDFGASKMIPSNELQVTTMVQGTLGYLDPEYMQSSQLTDKSDVYSFGVVILELITGKLPFSSQRSEAEKNLAAMFISYMKSNKLGELLDERIVSAATMDQLEDVANLAMQCLSLSGCERPTMSEVARRLEEIRKNEHLPYNHRYTERQNIISEMETISVDSGIYLEHDQTATLLESDVQSAS